MNNSEHLITANFNNLETGVYTIDSMFAHVSGSPEFDQYLKGRHIIMEFYNLPLGQIIRLNDLNNHENSVTFIRQVTQWKGIEVIDASDWQVELRQATYETSKEDQTIQLLIEIRDLLQALGEKR